MGATVDLATWMLLVVLQGSGDPSLAESPIHPFDRVVAIELSAADPALAGHGPCRWVEYVAEFSGTLHVWTVVEDAFDTFLRVDGAEQPLGQDDDSGGKPAPYVKVEVEPGIFLAIAVAASKPETFGDVELHLVAAPETEHTRAEAALAVQELDAIEALRDAGDVANARTRAAALVEHLARVENARASELVMQEIWWAGHQTNDLELLDPTARAWRLTLAHRSRTLPPDHDALQEARGNYASVIGALGDLAGERALQEQVLEVCSRTLPADHRDLLLARGSLAGTLSALGELDAARALQEQVLETVSRTLSPDHRDVQRAREGLASTLGRMGDLSGALALDRQVLEARSRTLSPDDLAVQRARVNLAGTLKRLGDLAGAQALQEAALEVLTRTLPEGHPTLHTTRANLAGTLNALGDLAAARALDEQVLEVALRTLPPDHPDLQEARLNLAGTIRKLGDLAGARALQEQALGSLSRTLPEDHPELQEARTSLASTLKMLGDVAGAHALQERALEVLSRTLPAEHPDLLAARSRHARLLHDRGEHAAALALDEEVLAVRSRTLREDHPDLVSARMHVGYGLHEVGDFARAHELFAQVLGLLSRTLPADHPSLQDARVNTAVTLKAMGDLAGARVLENEVLEFRTATLPPDHPGLQKIRANLASTIARQRAVESDAGRAANDGEGAAFASLVRDFILSLGRSAREALLSSSSREAEERCANLTEDVGRALSLAEGVGAFERDVELERLAFIASECTRSAPIASASLVRRVAAHPRYSVLREEIRSATAELARLAQQHAGSDDFDRARARREAAERELVDLARSSKTDETELFGLDLVGLSASLAESDAIVAYRRYERFRVDSEGRFNSVQSLCAFVVRSGSRLDRFELGPAATIESAVQSWRDAIGVRLERGIDVPVSLAREELDRGAGLRSLVLDPLEPAIAVAMRLVVLLDDVLHLVPLDALPSRSTNGDEPVTPVPPVAGSEGNLLGDRWRFETRCTLGELVTKEDAPHRGGSLVALGGPSFNSEPLPLSAEDVEALDERAEPVRMASLLRGGPWEHGFEPLTYSGLEARGIAALYAEAFDEERPALILEKRKASRSAVDEAAPKARFLHIATHGWFAPEAIRSMLDPESDAASDSGPHEDELERVRGMAPMLLCGLALAGANLAEDGLGRAPGLMTAEELCTLDLRNCELAVLSACDTNVGERRAGQGVASLQRALHMAGARSVITSLWKVPDEATKELMLDFYRRIWVLNEPKHEALWAAKKRLRDAVDERGNPKYTTRDWAAWVLTGEPD